MMSGSTGNGGIFYDFFNCVFWGMALGNELFVLSFKNFLLPMKTSIGRNNLYLDVILCRFLLHPVQCDFCFPVHSGVIATSNNIWISFADQLVPGIFFKMGHKGKMG